jgi:hypothetical protein
MEDTAGPCIHRLVVNKGPRNPPSLGTSPEQRGVTLPDR